MLTCLTDSSSQFFVKRESRDSALGLYAPLQDANSVSSFRIAMVAFGRVTTRICDRTLSFAGLGANLVVKAEASSYDSSSDIRFDEKAT